MAPSGAPNTLSPRELERCCLENHFFRCAGLLFESMCSHLEPFGPYFQPLGAATGQGGANWAMEPHFLCRILEVLDKKVCSHALKINC